MTDPYTRLINGVPARPFPVPDGFNELKTVEVFCDETGDRGWTNDSSTWFGMCAVMIPQESVPQMRATIGGLRHEIGTTKPLHWVEHFKKPKHAGRRTMAANMLAAIPGVRVIYVVADKATMVASNELRADGDLFYHYTMRLLLERVAYELDGWKGGRRKGIVRLGAVKGMNHKESVEYLTTVRLQRVAWHTPWDLMCWPPRWVGTNAFDGVQAADLYLGMFRRAVELGESRPWEATYLLQHKHQIRRNGAGRALGYGIKIFGDRTFITKRAWWSQI